MSMNDPVECQHLTTRRDEYRTGFNMVKYREICMQCGELIRSDAPLLTADKMREYDESIRRAQEWQKQEAEALASACKYLTQAANNEVPHD
jgi:hypothetical protein